MYQYPLQSAKPVDERGHVVLRHKPGQWSPFLDLLAPSDMLLPMAGASADDKMANSGQ